MSLRVVFGEFICIFGIAAYTQVYGNTTLHQHSKYTLLPLRRDKGSNTMASSQYVIDIRLVYLLLTEHFYLSVTEQLLVKQISIMIFILFIHLVTPQ